MSDWNEIVKIFRKQAPAPPAENLRQHRAAIEEAARIYASVWHALTFEYTDAERTTGHVITVDTEGCRFRVEIRQEAKF